MKLSVISAFLASTIITAAPAELQKSATVQGFDISHYQSSVNFKGAYDSGARFVIIKVSNYALLTGDRGIPNWG
jgi:GH25 family lysozyme M1 (1,4-beta-N-acetylmuramidase)